MKTKMNNIPKAAILFAIATLILVQACSKKDSRPTLIISSPKNELKYIESVQLHASSGNATDYTWKSSDPFVGTVDASGNFEARHIGETTVTAEKNGLIASLKMKVTPVETFLEEPVSDFGQNKNYVKAREKRTIKTETADAIFYTNTGLYATQIMYLFKNDALSACLVDLTETESAITHSLTFYKERYSYLGYENNIALFLSRDNKVLVGISVEDAWGLGAVYVRNTSGPLSFGKARLLFQTNRTNLTLN